MLEKAHAPISTSEVAFDRSRPVSLVFSKADRPIVLSLAGITSVPSRLVSKKALSPISTSEVASDRSRPVSLEREKARAPMVCTAGPTLSVPVRFVLPCRNPSGMAVMAGSASSQHAFAPLGAMGKAPPGAIAHLFNPGVATAIVDLGEGGGGGSEREESDSGNSSPNTTIDGGGGAATARAADWVREAIAATAESVAVVTTEMGAAAAGVGTAGVGWAERASGSVTVVVAGGCP